MLRSGLAGFRLQCLSIIVSGIRQWKSVVTCAGDEAQCGSEAAVIEMAIYNRLAPSNWSGVLAASGSIRPVSLFQLICTANTWRDEKRCRALVGDEQVGPIRQAASKVATKPVSGKQQRNAPLRIQRVQRLTGISFRSAFAGKGW